MFFKTSNAKVTGIHSSRGRTAGRVLSGFDYEPRDGKFLYVAVRACTADVPNLNYDMLPDRELKTAYRSFIGSYVYLNHDNQSPSKARGAIIDATYHTEDPDDKWVEILMEMDEERCPKLCSLIRSGDIDTVSMGCNVDSTTCSVCGNVAEYPFQFCEHIQQKGRTFNGKLAYEICNGIEFFEESWVYDPADPTAYTQAIDKTAMRRMAAPGGNSAGTIKSYLNTLYRIYEKRFGDYLGDFEKKIKDWAKKVEDAAKERAKYRELDNQKELTELFSLEDEDGYAPIRELAYDGKQNAQGQFTRVSVIEFTGPDGEKLYKTCKKTVKRNSDGGEEIVGDVTFDKRDYSSLDKAVQAGKDITRIDDYSNYEKFKVDGADDASDEEGYADDAESGDVVDAEKLDDGQLEELGSPEEGRCHAVLKREDGTLAYCRNRVSAGDEYCYLHKERKMGLLRRFADSFATAPRVPDEVDLDSENIEACPLCGDPNFDGEFCNICGYEEPPEGFGDIDLEDSDSYDEYEDDSESEQSGDIYDFEPEDIGVTDEDVREKADELAQSGQAADDEFGDEDEEPAFGDDGWQAPEDEEVDSIEFDVDDEDLEVPEDEEKEKEKNSKSAYGFMDGIGLEPNKSKDVWMSDDPVWSLENAWIEYSDGCTGHAYGNGEWEFIDSGSGKVVDGVALDINDAMAECDRYFELEIKRRNAMGARRIRKQAEDVYYGPYFVDTYDGILEAWVSYEEGFGESWYTWFIDDGEGACWDWAGRTEDNDEEFSSFAEAFASLGQKYKIINPQKQSGKMPRFRERRAMIDDEQFDKIVDNVVYAIENGEYDSNYYGVNEAISDFAGRCYGISLTGREMEDLYFTLMYELEEHGIIIASHKCSSWSDFDNPVADKMNELYLPNYGEGDTMASQIATAVNKLVYKWFNDGDVFDNVHTGLEGWANDLSSYANWLYTYVNFAQIELHPALGELSENEYESILHGLFEATLCDESFMENYSEQPAVGSVYNCPGPFEWDDSYGEDEDDWYDDDEDY